MSSLLNKVTSGLWSALTSAASRTESAAMGHLAKRYPDMEELLQILEQIKLRVQDVPDEAATSDDKWRPALLTIALLYKLQKLRDHSDGGWYRAAFAHIAPELQGKLLGVFGCYWHICLRVAKGLRSYEANKENGQAASLVEHLSQDSGFQTGDIVFAHSTDSRHLEGGHCPDFAVVVVHPHRQVLINICGTRMIPQPKMMDVFMDLSADAAPFLTGRAHRGMAAGAENIMAKCREAVVRKLESLQGYGLLITGYSLGAGICQLLTMSFLELQRRSELPSAVEIRCISYGSPPVFECPDDGEFALGNVFSVVNCNDGLASASLDTVTRFFEEIKAVEEVRLGRREMLKMLVQKIPTKEAGKSIHVDDDDDDDDESSVVDDGCLPDNWKAVLKAVESVEREDRMGVARLDHPAAKLFHFKRLSKEPSDVATRLFTNSKPLCVSLRLKPSMFSHHMPGGYTGLFELHGTSVEEVPLVDFEEVLALRS